MLARSILWNRCLTLDAVGYEQVSKPHLSLLLWSTVIAVTSMPLSTTAEAHLTAALRTGNLSFTATARPFNDLCTVWSRTSLQLLVRTDCHVLDNRIVDLDLLFSTKTFDLSSFKLLRAATLHAGGFNSFTWLYQVFQMSFDAILTENMFTLQSEHFLFLIVTVADLARFQLTLLNYRLLSYRICDSLR